MERALPVISFIVPFASEEPHRVKHFHFVKTYLESFPNSEVVVTALSAHGEFSRSRSRNAGARMAHGNVLAFVDADSVVSHEWTNMGVALIESGHTGVYLPFDEYRNLDEKGTEDFYAGATDPSCEFILPSPANPVPAVSGVVMVSAETFKQVWYDERFIGWGEEDRAFEIAISTVFEPTRRGLGTLWHLWHPAPESERFGNPYFAANRDLCDQYRAAQGNRERMLDVIWGG
jgi:predicted glycosyltransferase involved in capsule biosynthesis